MAIAAHKSSTPSAVYAFRDGKVAYARLNGSDTEGYGNVVIIDHADDRYSLYAHLSMHRPASGKLNLLVKVGDEVCAGQTIGHFRRVTEEWESDSTGNATKLPDHLAHQVHFAILKAPSGRTSAGRIGEIIGTDGEFLDPSQVLKEQGVRTLKVDD